MTRTRMVGLVLAAAGRGSRFASAGEDGTAENKIWAMLGGRPLLAWTLEAFQSHPDVETIVLVGATPELERLRATAEAFSKVSAVVPGGSSRAESVGAGLRALPGACEIALVHDAARPAASAGLISRIIDGVREHGAAVPGQALSDTIKRVAEDGLVRETVPREELRTVQTPQGARLADLLAAYDRLGDKVCQLTDEAAVLEAAGYAVYVVDGEDRNLKVTRPEDLEKARAALGLSTPQSAADVRTGLGYDVHMFAEKEAERDLWLGGVRIPHDRGLKGHSDADVLLHAVCDALLGAAGMGDIGVVFPDTDSAHKDRRSMEFVEEVRERLDAERWSVVNVDITLLAESPRIGPYRDQMTAALAGGLRIATSRINLKATTSEKMGFVGRHEGMACWAIATLRRPESSIPPTDHPKDTSRQSS